MKSTHVPFLDLRAAVDDAYRRVLDSGWFLLGEETSKFEQAFAETCETEHAVVTSTGLEALILALRALDIGGGDEVIVPGLTFVATWLAVSGAGATPIPVDVDLATANIDPARIEAAITPRTKAIMPVHLQGRVADMAPIMELADRFGLHVVEDAAQSHAARRGGQVAGSFGIAAGFSFYPGKNLGALGDGGAVTTDDASVATRLRALRNYSSVVKYVHDERGVNSRLDELQCAFLRARLDKVAAWNARRGEIAARYLEAFANIDGLTLPPREDDIEHVWHVFAVRTEKRDQLARDLAAHGVDTIIHYPTPPHRTGAYATYGELDLPISDRIASSTLSLPIGPHMSDTHVEHVIGAVEQTTAQ